MTARIVLILNAFLFSSGAIQNGCQQKAIAQEGDTFLQLQSQNAISSCVHFLDGHLCLTMDQTTLIRKLIESSWDEANNENVAHIISNGYSVGKHGFTRLDDEQLNKFLTERQMEQFRILKTDPLGLQVQINWITEKSGEVDDPIQRHLDVASKLEIARLKRTLLLEDSQNRRLQIAIKGACKEIKSMRAKLKKSFDGDIENILNQQACYERLMDAPIYQLAKSKVWQNSISELLTEEQLNTFQTECSRTRLRSVEAAMFSILMNYRRRGIQFKEHEYQKLVELGKRTIFDSVEKENPGNRMPCIFFEVLWRFPTTVKDEELAKILSGQKLERLKRLLQNSRE